MPSALITSRDNQRVKQLRAAFAGNARLADGLVAIEGENLIREALRSGIELRAMFLSERTASPDWLPRGVEVLHLSESIFASAVDTQTPQGLAALVEPSQWQLEEVLSTDGEAPPLLLIAAGLQDPGNLGTLIRSAEAFAATAVLTTAGTVSFWNQKALRASAGSVFRMPVLQVSVSEVRGLKERRIQILAAVAPDATERHAAFPDLTRATALMIGNEGHGLSSDLLALADTHISIPTPGPVESLNAAVAGSLLLYEAARQREGAGLRAASERTTNH